MIPGTPDPVLEAGMYSKTYGGDKPNGKTPWKRDILPKHTLKGKETPAKTPKTRIPGIHHDPSRFRRVYLSGSCQQGLFYLLFTGTGGEIPGIL